jgi:glycosyltransferase involved in cell wall biosynthesis
MTRILVLNELHPNEQPGAATIALDYASALAKFSDTIFVHTSISDNVQETQIPKIKSLARGKGVHRAGYSGELQSTATDLFGVVKASRYLKEIRGMNPDFIWVHQIGNFIPRLLLFFLSSVAPVVMTIHDYSLIIPRKLYPSDLDRPRLYALNVDSSPSNRSVRQAVFAIFKTTFYKLRRLTLRLYLRRVKLVCISQQQAQIYRSYGYRVVAVIPNGIAKCTCIDTASTNRLNSVLFLGRLTGKGVDRLLESVSDSGTSAVFAGGEDLNEKITKFPGKLNARFLGHLNRDEVFSEIHKTSFVYLASDCFDVYPTTGLEAIRHGAMPIVSETTGLRDLVRLIEPTFVLDSRQNHVPIESYFRAMEIRRAELYSKLEQVNESLATVEQSLKHYLDFMQIS